MRDEELVRSLVADLTPVRRLCSVELRTAAWALLALGCMSLGASLLGLRGDLMRKLGDPTYLIESATLLVVFASSAWSGFRLSVPGAEPARLGRLIPGLGAAVWVLLIASRGACDSCAALTVAPAGWSCVWRIVGLAVAPGAAMFALLRRAAPGERARTGGLAVLSTSALAALATQMVCRDDDPAHLLHWHVAPVLIAGLLGVAAGRLLLPRGSGAPHRSMGRGTYKRRRVA